jgi:hypothetical protein
MNKELQRIRIAEACGFDKSHWLELKGGIVFGTSGSLPDYPNDLNAMHEAWQTLTSDQRITYRGELAKICAREAPERDTCWLEDIAAEFAPEAFLKTLGLWKEES